MSERRPDDVLARCVGVVNASMITEGDAAWHWRVVTDELDRARRVELEQSEQLRQKDEAIRALADALEHMTHIAAGLHAIYRGAAHADSDGSHEKAFADALALVKKARTP